MKSEEFKKIIIRSLIFTAIAQFVEIIAGRYLRNKEIEANRKRNRLKRKTLNIVQDDKNAALYENCLSL